MGDLKIVLARIVALRQSIADDGILNGVPFRSEDIQNLVERLNSEGSSFVKVTCPILGKALDAALICGTFSCPANFATRKGTRLPKFLYLLFEKIFDSEGVLRSSPDLTTMFFLRQFLSLDGKLITEPTAKQKEAAWNGFCDRQKRLGKTKIPIDNPVLIRARKLLSRTLKDCDLSAIIPGHGPGGVAEGLNRFERWDFRTWPSRAERWYPFHEYGSQSFTALCIQGSPRVVRKSYTKCSLVPKDFKGPRLISSESAATQYLQQGQMKLLMRFVENHRLLRRSISFKDQTYNEWMCMKSYENGSVTIDLSNASDTVSAALVWYLLSGVPKLRSQLFCTRSQSMRMGREEVRITAFSPMGSAVCFPVETLVFWALSMASVRFVQHHWQDGSKDPTCPSETEMASAIAVFGDDIIVPDYAMAVLIGTLESVGCEVNTSKTCYQTPFRESCGSEYFNHTDVAIIRNRRYDYDDSKKIISYPVLLDLQRKFFLCGLYSTAALLREWARFISPVITQVPRGAEILLDSHHNLYVQARRPLVPGLRCEAGWRSRADTRRRALVDCLTAVPSSFNRSARQAGIFDDLCCAFGGEHSLDSGVPCRYNNDLQKVECRLPRVFQQTKEWDRYQLPGTEGSQKYWGFRAGDRKSSPEVERQLKSAQSGYPRLLARVVGDSVERIAIRTHYWVKMAWSELPHSLASQLVRR